MSPKRDLVPLDGRLKDFLGLVNAEIATAGQTEIADAEELGLKLIMTIQLLQEATCKSTSDEWKQVRYHMMARLSETVLQAQKKKRQGFKSTLQSLLIEILNKLESYRRLDSTSGGGYLEFSKQVTDDTYDLATDLEKKIQQLFGIEQETAQ